MKPIEDAKNMTEQRFLELLSYPNITNHPGLIEIDAYLAKYPYCQSLHTLKAKIQQLAKHPNQAASLHLAATYASDRTHLYHSLKNLHAPTQSALQAPEFLVDLSHDFEEKTLQLEEPPIGNFEILPLTPPPETPLQFSPETTSTTNHNTNQLTVNQEIPQADLAPNYQHHSMEKNNEILNPTLNTTPTKSTNSEDFITWLRGMQAPDIHPHNQVKPAPKSTASTPARKQIFSDKGKRLKKLIEKSIVDDNEIATETLAQLLVSQGKNNKAIKMYRQLILNFPEKSAYFAAKIDELS